MGWALARAAVLRGADVRLVAANVGLPAPPGAEVEAVSSTADLAQAMAVAAKDADIAVMAAAPADFTPATRQSDQDQENGRRWSRADAGPDHRRARQPCSGQNRLAPDPGRLCRGNPSEGQTLLDLGRAKLARKGCDLLVLNEVGPNLVFGQPDSQITILSAEGATGPTSGSKDTLAHQIWDEALALTVAPVGFRDMARRLFTSESVTEGHPDKIADQISDSVLDELLRQDPNSRVAVECLVTTGLVVVAGEVTTESYVEIPRVVRERIIDIGYDSSTKGFDGGSCGVEIAIGQQSPDIAQGVDVAFESRTGESTDLLDLQGAGDQGLMFGYACSETPSLMPLPIDVAHQTCRTACRGTQRRHHALSASRRQDPGDCRVRR